VRLPGSIITGLVAELYERPFDGHARGSIRTWRHDVLLVVGYAGDDALILAGDGRLGWLYHP